MDSHDVDAVHVPAPRGKEGTVHPRGGLNRYALLHPANGQGDLVVETVRLGDLRRRRPFARRPRAAIRRAVGALARREPTHVSTVEHVPSRSRAT